MVNGDDRNLEAYCKLPALLYRAHANPDLSLSDRRLLVEIVVSTLPAVRCPAERREQRATDARHDAQERPV
jgi:hypothetical protein